MGSIDDGYVGSNDRLQNAYKKRPQDFKRRILHYHQPNDNQSLRDIEGFILQWHVKHEELNLKGNINIKYYNQKRCSYGGYNENSIIKTKELSEKGLLYSQSEEGRERNKILQKSLFDNNSHPLQREEIKIKVKKINKKRGKERAENNELWMQSVVGKKSNSDRVRKNNYLLAQINEHPSQKKENKEKFTAIIQELSRNKKLYLQTDEGRKKQSERMKNKKWYYNPTTLEKMYFDQENIPDGWLPGMRPKDFVLS